MKTPDQKLKALTESARLHYREVQASDDGSAPLGFATRVAALAMARTGPSPFFEMVSRWATGITLTSLALAALGGFYLSHMARDFMAEERLAAEEEVAEFPVI
ncbi:MAG: hypothetical protein SFY92_06335 [Verrucomicrobiae bacterium]|nr:hypothetical protein [Verrucomicrobiae bacterium]